MHVLADETDEGLLLLELDGLLLSEVAASEEHVSFADSVHVVARLLVGAEKKIRNTVEIEIAGRADSREARIAFGRLDRSREIRNRSTRHDRRKLARPPKNHDSPRSHGVVAVVTGNRERDIVEAVDVAERTSFAQTHPRSIERDTKDRRPKTCTRKSEATAVRRAPVNENRGVDSGGFPQLRCALGVVDDQEIVESVVIEISDTPRLLHVVVDVYRRKGREELPLDHRARAKRGRIAGKIPRQASKPPPCRKIPR